MQVAVADALAEFFAPSAEPGLEYYAPQRYESMELTLQRVASVDALAELQDSRTTRVFDKLASTYSAALALTLMEQYLTTERVQQAGCKCMAQIAPKLRHGARTTRALIAAMQAFPGNEFVRTDATKAHPAALAALEKWPCQWEVRPAGSSVAPLECTFTRLPDPSGQVGKIVGCTSRRRRYGGLPSSRVAA